MRRRLIAGNWKMNTTIREARDLAVEIRTGLDSAEDIDVVLCPPFTALAAVAEQLGGSRIEVGAQNLYYEASGAYTGEVSPEMVAELCTYVIVGHSERRQLFAETEEAAGKKVAAALDAGLTPILCVGERLDDREAGQAEAVVERQLRMGLAGVGVPGGLAVAYEPVWAIGTGRAATPSDAQAMMGHLRDLLAARFGAPYAAEARLLYGGSVTDENVADFVRKDDIDGALVGGASLKVDVFVPLVLNALKAPA